MTRLLVTGLSGFVGGAIVRAFEEGLAPPSLELCRTSMDYELRDPAAVQEMLSLHRPDAVIHLAGQAHVMASLEDPETTLQINTVGTATLLRLLAQSGFQGPMLYVSSADVYGVVPEASLPVDESRPAQPRNPYAVSKLASEWLCMHWASSLGIRAVIARAFNHAGRGQRPEFALSGFARDAVAIRLGLQPPTIPVGDLDVTRDFLDVRDVVNAYFGLVTGGQSGGIYNVCSGTEIRLRDALEIILESAGVQADIVPDSARMRPSEQRRMRGSNRKLTDDTGWSAKFSLRDTVQDLVDYWDKELQK